MTNTATPTSTLANVIDAMRSVQTESDRWHLAEALYAKIPHGMHGFDEIIDAAAAAGVAGSLKPNTLRLYRDTVERWPVDLRVPNVSFSAHREAMACGNATEAAKLLAQLSATLGADKVTVASVRRAVLIKNGKAVPSGSPAPAAPVVKGLDVLADLRGGGTVVKNMMNGTTPGLDEIHAGLQSVIAHVEQLRAKAARKAKAPASSTPAAASSTPVVKPAAKAKKAGDLRGL